jgi:CHAD domain-containing protein
MARAREVPLDCGEAFSSAALQVISVRAKEVFEQAHDVLDLADPERVHDMRVATRRLRAAMEVFQACFPPKRFRRALKEVKALADALGERRDRDVEIELLEHFAEEADAGEREELSALIRKLRREQAQANEELAIFVATPRLERLRIRLGRLVEDGSR